jgi:tetratricopeptide (TPR) repeat protein
LLTRAEYLMRIGENYAAIFDANQIIKIDSTHEDARYIRAMSYFYESDYDKSIEDLTYLVNSANPKMKAFYLNYLESVRNIKENSEKLLTDNQPEFYINIAKALSRIKEFDSAIKILNDGLAKNRNNTRLIYAKLLVYLEMGDLNAARELVEVLKSAGVEVDEKVRLMINR